MSSDIMSRPVDVSKYALIYGGAQKNVGPAGVTFVIVREDVLGKITDRKNLPVLPTMVDYRTHIEKESMFNTPPVISIFVMHETLKWLKENGGVEWIQKRNQEKADLLYNEIDRNKMFVGTVAKEDRSLMNVCFVMAKGYEDKEKEFMEFAKANGMIGIKGHRSVGGFRASLYNACELIAYIPLFFIFDYSQIDKVQWTGQMIGDLICLGVFCSAGSYGFYSFAAKKLSVEKVSVFNNVAPIITILAAVLMGMELFTIRKTLGILIVVLGVIINCPSTKSICPPL